jgi:hypothetical protein
MAALSLLSVPELHDEHPPHTAADRLHAMVFVRWKHNGVSVFEGYVHHFAHRTVSTIIVHGLECTTREFAVFAQHNVNRNTAAPK